MRIALVPSLVAVLSLVQAAPAAADSISLSVMQPVYAGGSPTVTASGMTDPGADVSVDMTIKPQGGTCAADPQDDAGSQVYGTLAGTAGADGSYSVRGQMSFSDTAGLYLVCAWMYSDGNGGAGVSHIAAASSAVLDIIKPPVAVSVVGTPSNLPPSRLGSFKVGSVRYDVGATSRILIWFLQLASRGCGRVDSHAGASGVPVSGAGSVALRISATPADGRYVVCAYIGDQAGKEVDGYAASSVITLGRASCIVPRLVGKTLAAAARAVAASGCKSGHLRYKHSSRSKQGRILSQTPPPGRRLDTGSAVNVVVGCARGNRYRGVLYCIGLPLPS